MFRLTSICVIRCVDQEINVLSTLFTQTCAPHLWLVGKIPLSLHTGVAWGWDMVYERARDSWQQPSGSQIDTTDKGHFTDEPRNGVTRRFHEYNLDSHLSQTVNTFSAIHLPIHPSHSLLLSKPTARNIHNKRDGLIQWFHFVWVCVCYKCSLEASLNELISLSGKWRIDKQIWRGISSSWINALSKLMN